MVAIAAPNAVSDAPLRCWWGTIRVVVRICWMMRTAPSAQAATSAVLRTAVLRVRVVAVVLEGVEEPLERELAVAGAYRVDVHETPDRGWSTSASE
jgi:hypothetical protein